MRCCPRWFATTGPGPDRGSAPARSATASAATRLRRARRTTSSSTLRSATAASSSAGSRMVCAEAPEGAQLFVDLRFEQPVGVTGRAQRNDQQDKHGHEHAEQRQRAIASGLMILHHSEVQRDASTLRMPISAYRTIRPFRANTALVSRLHSDLPSDPRRRSRDRCVAGRPGRYPSSLQSGRAGRDPGTARADRRVDGHRERCHCHRRFGDCWFPAPVPAAGSTNVYCSEAHPVRSQSPERDFVAQGDHRRRALARSSDVGGVPNRKSSTVKGYPSGRNASSWANWAGGS